MTLELKNLIPKKIENTSYFTFFLVNLSMCVGGGWGGGYCVGTLTRASIEFVKRVNFSTVKPLLNGHAGATSS